MRYLFLAAILLSGCATPQPPIPIAPIPRVDLKPVKDRGQQIQQGNQMIGTKLEDTRAKLDAALVEAHQAKVDMAKLDENLQAASDSLAAASAEQKAQSDRINGLLIDIDQAQEKEDKANLAANAAVERANTAEGKVYKYELQEKEDEGNWGLNGVWRWIRYLGWHVIILVVIIAAITMAIRLFLPAVIPIFTGIWAGVLWAVRGLWHIVSLLWRPKPPP